MITLDPDSLLKVSVPGEQKATLAVSTPREPMRVGTQKRHAKKEQLKLLVIIFLVFVNLSTARR